MKVATIMVVCLVTLLALTETALAEWPSGTSGDQYNFCNNALNTAVTDPGISTDTFINVYNSAIAGDVSGYTDSQLGAVCQVLTRLPDDQCSLEDYTTVYNNLACSTRPPIGDPARSSLPSTGIPLAILMVSGAVGIGAALRLRKQGK